ncbi:hypothetical protein VP1G_00044 [Cytospora mali]|uniref:Uncharacterized protein n=1 Tax=Cytospora mali TaxID=578113 RepID=A0A194ULQ6_CYTMA|nr:hypothetical protein VP1G_00044 [Valsa mali var. pyri (nom. inval.)]
MDSTSLAARFVEDRGPGIHRAFTFPAKYDESRRVFMPRRNYRPWEPMKGDVDDLKHAIEEYRTHFGDSDQLLDLERCTWADVFKQMDAAKLQKDEKDGKVLGRCRALWHKLGNKVKVEDIDPWLDLIPDEYRAFRHQGRHSAYLEGGIVAKIDTPKAAKHSAEKDEKICELMVEVVDTLALVCPKAKIFGNNQGVDTAVRELYVAVLDSVSTIVRYLRGRNIRSKLSRARDRLDGTSVVQVSNIEHKIEIVRKKATNFENAYLILKDELMREFLAVQKDTWTRMQVMSTDILESQSANRKFHQQFHDSMEQRKVFEDNIIEESRRQRELLEEVPQLRTALQGINAFLRSSEERFAAQEALPTVNLLLAPHGQQLFRSRTPSPGPSAFITVDELCQVLRISPKMANNDLEMVIIERHWFNDKAHGVAQSLLNYTEFRDWFVGVGSQVLLVDGNDEDHANVPISAVSILAVDIMSSLLKADYWRRVAVLHFFCGLHSTEEEGPRFMMRALILQLLFLLHKHRRLNLDFINSEAYVLDLQSANSAALLHMFQRLCHQLPPNLTVYCFIDGVSFYESRWLRFHDEMVEFLRMITQVMMASVMPGSPDYGNFYDAHGSGNPRYKLKVLLTSANGTIFDQYVQSCIALSGSDVGFGLPNEAAVEDALAYIESGVVESRSF